MIAKLPLVTFVIIKLTRLTAGVCMKVRFKSKVTRGFSLLAASRLVFAALSRLKKNLWDQGTAFALQRNNLKSCFSFIFKVIL